MKQSVITSGKTRWKENVILSSLFILCPPVGIFRIWKSRTNIFLKIAYTLLGLPVFVVLYSYFGVILFAAFLPPLDLSVGDRQDRTIINSDGNYQATFIKTAAETHNEFELIQVDVEGHGGNGPHYHNAFEEHFTVMQGTVTMHINDKSYILMEGDSITILRGSVHWFRNESDSLAVVTVKTTPACGLEKTLRVSYGLINSGQMQHGLTKNPWHICLLMGYSGSYMHGIPPIIQEPLVNSLARIAQWKGEDESLKVFYR